jgi:putative ABC transport system substrate-binding protein
MGMRRREFITLVGGAVAWPIAARAQQAGRVTKIGILASGNQLNSPMIESFRQELRTLGYVEGRDTTIEFRTTAGGDFARIGAFAAELANTPVDIIVTDGTPASLAARQATASIPVVMAVIADPVAIGLVQSYARPGGNITGFSIFASELGAKRLEILKEALPGLKRVGVLWNSANPLNASVQTPMIIEAARGLGIEVELSGTPDRDGLAAAFERFTAQQVSAVLTLPEAMLFQERQRIVDLATAARLPGMYPDRPFADVGGLLFYGPDVRDLFRRAAGYVDRILKGAKPAELPVEQPTRFELVVNLKAAQAIGITLPPTLLTRADVVIE